ncbi:small integral membrane protein 8 [Bombus huntii]|uniref:small integral membrane protein 8 n=1 Tax=Bombus huntii TaxID=85661 RepID=UPI0021A9FC9F|nr:small integral membrane protein 8 [Bombus huntii]
MDKKNHKAEPGDGLRSLKSTMLFRAINYELYVKPNKVVMIFGAIAMFSCIGYMAYMRHNSDNTNHYPAVTSDGSINLKKKTSKWTM